MNRRQPGSRLILTVLLTAAACLLVRPGEPARAGGNIEVIISGQIGNKFWDSRTLPFKWFLNQNIPLGLTLANLNAVALEPAFASWTNLPDNNFAAVFNGFGGNVPGVNTPVNNGSTLIFDPRPQDLSGFVAAAPCITLTATFNVVDSSDGNPSNGLGFIKIGAANALLAPVGSYGPGTNVDCDIIYDTVAVTFSTTNVPGTEDIQGITTHETGHWHSLSHSPFPEATMYPFTDTNPPGDGIAPGGGSASLEPDDIASAGHIYKDANYDTNNGTVTGTIFINGARGTAVHVTALRTSDLKAVAGRFSLSQFLRTADPIDGTDLLANGSGFYRLDGLPPGDYYICYDQFDGTDERLGGRLGTSGSGAPYNSTTANSTVADGGIGGNFNGTLGFRPERTECYNTLESADGGDGSTPGAAVDNPDEAKVVTVAAGAVVAGIDIQVNLRPTGTTTQRSDPTGIGRHDLASVSNLALVNLAATPDLNNDDYWLVIYPSTVLPTPPFNIMEGIWSKFGLSDDAYIAGLALADPATPSTIQAPIVWDARRLVTGWDGGNTGISELFEVRDRFNVTINTPTDVFFIIKQPEPAAGTTLTVERYFVVTHDAGAGLASQRSLFTTDDFATFFTSTRFEVLHRARSETAPPVMINSASPATVAQGTTGNVITITGAGFRSGATVEFSTPTFGPPLTSSITVTNVNFVSSTMLTATIDVDPFAPATFLDVQVTNPEVIIPNRARLMSVLAGADGDMDGFIDVIDCAPANANLWAIPGTIGSSVEVSEPVPGTARVTWQASALPGSTSDRYRVVAGEANTLQGSAGTDYGTCLADDLLLLFTDDAGALTVGEITTYMVSQKNTCGTGTYGTVLRDANSGNCSP